MLESSAAFPVSADVDRRFGGIERLYGEGALARLSVARVGVIGLGGVGSWVAEALARSGVGALKLVDLDNIAESNINRQVHALDATLGQAKVDAMTARIQSINPHCRVDKVEDFLTPENTAALLHDVDAAVDAIDDVRAKAAMAVYCSKQRCLPLLMAGGAGGKTDPRRIQTGDLAHTRQDPLLSRVRARLRREHGFTREPGKNFGIEAVYSDEPVRRPAACPGGSPRGLSCAGYGSSMTMTASIGLFIAARILERLLRVRSGESA
ncbi:MAG: tRNA threonylcarbamoyladenosine dehydratase [Azoarcus sp.]|nr:tRNA threonylcarbamoyladenosine dehydratase [Azoarcus sp.]